MGLIPSELLELYDTADRKRILTRGEGETDSGRESLLSRHSAEYFLHGPQ